MADGQITFADVGWHSMREDRYHGDPCPEPSLSSSSAKTIIDSTLLHAWMAHPRNPEGKPFTPSNTMNIGKAVHAAVFGGAEIQVIDFGSFQKKEAREQRDAALASGLIPILVGDLPRIEAMADLAKERFDGLYGGPYHAERVAIWKCPRKGGWRRGMLDTSAKAAPIIVDYKTTMAAVDDESCIKRIFDQGLHIQAAAYEEAMTQLNPEWAGRVRFFFQWQEQDFPYALSRPIEMSEAGMTLGREQWAVAGALWDKAIETMTFPGYGKSPTEASPPPWVLTKWDNRMNFDETLTGAAA